MPKDYAPIGITLVRPAEIMGAEPYFHDLIAGIERVTLPHGYSVLLRVLATDESELATYTDWAAGKRVSATLLADMVTNDPRPRLVHDLGLPTIIIGPPDFDSFTSVWTDDDEAMRATVNRLADLGHRSILHVGGPAALIHSQRRRDAFTQTCHDLGVRSSHGLGDYSRASGAEAMQAALSDHPSVTAAIFDSDLMALGGLDAARSAGLAVPGALSIVAWNDSALCQLSTPSLTAVARDAQAVGRLAGAAVLQMLAGGPVTLMHAPSAVLVERASTGPTVTDP